MTHQWSASVCCTELHRAVTSAPSVTLERCVVPALSQMLSLKITAGAHDALKAVWEWIQTTRLQHLAGEPESTDGMKDGHTRCNIIHCSSEFLMTPQTKHFCHCHLPLKPDVYRRSDRETAHSLANNSTITSYWSVRISWIIIVFTSLNEKKKRKQG